MSREPVLQGGSQPADDDRDLRPQHMNDMVGQRDVYERIEIAVDAATKREEPLGHMVSVVFANARPGHIPPKAGGSHMPLVGSA